MTASELRIGNLVNTPMGHVCVITGMFYDNDDKTQWVYYSPLRSGCHWSDVKGLNTLSGLASNFSGIPITEEWLLKSGYELDEDFGDIKYYKKDKLSVCFNHEDLSFNYQTMFSQTCIIYDAECFQYVHNLQNITHALTGKELEINQK